MQIAPEHPQPDSPMPQTSTPPPSERCVRRTLLPGSMMAIRAVCRAAPPNPDRCSTQHSQGYGGGSSSWPAAVGEPSVCKPAGLFLRRGPRSGAASLCAQRVHSAHHKGVCHGAITDGLPTPCTWRDAQRHLHMDNLKQPPRSLSGNGCLGGRDECVRFGRMARRRHVATVVIDIVCALWTVAAAKCSPAFEGVRLTPRPARGFPQAREHRRIRFRRARTAWSFRASQS